MKKLTPHLLLFAALTFSSAVAHAQTTTPEVRVTIQPAQSPEDRVKDEEKLKDLRKAADDKRAADEAARITETSPKNLLGKTRIVFIHSNSTFFESVQLQNALRKRSEFDQ